MSERDNNSSYKELKKNPPKLEDIISAKLDGEVKQAVLDFVGYCKGNKITYPWGTSNMWYLTIKGKHVGNLRVGGIQVGNINMSDNSWHVSLNLRDILTYMKPADKDDLAEIIWKYIKRCEGCLTTCRPGRTMAVLGKDFNNVCLGFGVKFNNPDAEQIGYIKKLMEVIIKAPIGLPSRPLPDPDTTGLVRIDNKTCVSGVLDSHSIQNEIIERLFDGKYSTLFYTGPNPHEGDERDYEIFFQLDNPVTLSMYSLVSSKMHYFPDKWTLYGTDSKDDAWRQLDTRVRSNAFPGPVTRYTEKAFSINTPGAYRFYKLTLAGKNKVLSQVHLYK